MSIEQPKSDFFICSNFFLVITGRNDMVYFDAQSPPVSNGQLEIAGAKFRFRRAALSGGASSFVVTGRGPVNDTLEVKVMIFILHISLR